MIQEYIDYFQDLAAVNKLLSDQTGKPFAIMDLDESMKGFITDIPYGGYFFRLVIPSMTVNYNNSDQHNQTMQGMFIVGKMYNIQDDGSKIPALVNAEDLAYLFTERMVHDSRNFATSFIGQAMNNPNFTYEPELVDGDNSYASIRVLFSMAHIRNFCEPLITNWTDL